MKSALRVGYITTGSASDVGNWSGLVAHIREALVVAGHHVTDIDNLRFPVPLPTRMRGWISRFMARRPYGYDRDLSLARRFAQEAEKKLTGLDLDCLVSPRSYPLAMLRTKLPMACWGDATFHALRGLYPGFDRLPAISIRQGDELEQRAIKNCSLLAYSARWAADDAIQHYGAVPTKVHVIPFGANCEPPFADEAAAQAAILKRRPQPLRLLFVGVDWERKGGAFALRVLEELLRRGVAAELWVAGCDPFDGKAPKGVKCFGFLSKASAADAETWRRCFSECHVFLLPTQAECFGVVFAEAAVFALPSLAPRVGGVADAAREGGNGYLFNANEQPDAYADLLQSWVDKWEIYQQAALQAWRTSRELLNWKVAGARFSQLLMECVSHR